MVASDRDTKNNKCSGYQYDITIVHLLVNATGYFLVAVSYP